MKRTSIVMSLALFMFAVPAEAQYQGGEQIRIKDFCATYSKRLKAQLANPLYEKALIRKKQGKLLPMSRERLEYVERLRAGLRFGKCGNTR